MAKIKRLQMWETICADARLSVVKSLWGLCTKVLYTQTGSVVEARVVEYTPADGERIKRILNVPRETLADEIGDFRPKATVNGHYIVEVCASKDGKFVALQLSQFMHMRYEPVTPVLVYEGEEAGVIGQLF